LNLELYTVVPKSLVVLRLKTAVREQQQPVAIEGAAAGSAISSLLAASDGSHCASDDKLVHFCSLLCMSYCSPSRL